ncbi:MAG: transposase [Candidatus Krumholzibacteriia bacterium]
MGKKRKARVGGRGRFSVKRKTEAVFRLLRGEDLDTLSRELGVTAATLSSWRATFIAAGQASMKSRREEPHEEEVRDLKAMIGDLTMRNELLQMRIERFEGEVPLPLRRSKP